MRNKGEAVTDYNRRFRAAMKWWRAANPERSPYTRAIRHGWYGHCLWNTERDAGVLMTAQELMEAHIAATTPDRENASA